MSDLKVGRIEQLTHTPGPWIRDGAVVLSPDERRMRFAIAERVRGRTGEEQTANARLIAAAPDLLAALKAVVAVLQKEAPGTALNSRAYDAVGAQAHAAIAKAEGR